MFARRISAAFLVLAVALCGCHTLGERGTTAYLSGQSEARHALAGGRLELETCGLPADWTPEYERLLLERYGIQTRPVAGCIVTDQILDHERGYNEVMRDEIQRRFGSRIWKETIRDAQKTHENKID
jgi:hypothetical protein